MKITFLGTGTSHGIPAIGCSCEVCRSSNPRNKRRRTSLYVRAGDLHLIIDTPPDFREQVLSFGVERVDAVLLTHAHADHIFGFDDLRRFCFMQKMVIPVYGSADTLASMHRKFDYVFQESIWRASVPQVEFLEAAEPWVLGDVEIEPVAVPHGPMSVYGYVIRHAGRGVGYFPDCSDLHDETCARLTGLDIMILDALRERAHPTHLNLTESVDALRRIGARRSYITHLCHDLEHEHTQSLLPEGITVPYDGLVVET